MARDDAEAARWFRMAADEGLPQAEYFVGVMYEHGVAVAQDYSEAVHWYRRAAEQGHALVQYPVEGSGMHATGRWRRPQDECGGRPLVAQGRLTRANRAAQNQLKQRQKKGQTPPR